MSSKTLRYLRRILAASYCGLLLIFILDLWRVLPWQTGALFHLQLVPAIVGGFTGIAVALLIITWLSGRIYCSVLCPLGVLQDFIMRVKKWSKKFTGKRKKVKLKYYKPFRGLRYSILAAVAICAILGFTYPLTMLDPYSIFGRIATSLFKPVVVGVNNFAAGWLNDAGYYWTYVIAHQSTSPIVIVLSAVMLVSLTVLVWWRGRIWCNSVCPVGTLLGFASKYSFFRVRIQTGKCTRCGLCEMACKAGCIDSKARTVDSERCVACFNCLDKCKSDAITYSRSNTHATRESAVKEESVDCENSSRRKFLKDSALLMTVVASGSIGRSLAQSSTNATDDGRTGSIKAMPPGAVSRKHFERTCTACQLCVSKCPTQVLRPAFMENSLSGMMQPYMHFQVESFCTYECTLCSQICPNHALLPLSIEEKKTTRVGEVHFLRKFCIVQSKGQDCGACAEHCPTAAVKMVPFRDGLTIPQIDTRYCIGCGGCESICPVSPPAIYVQGLSVQDTALPPSKDKLEVNQLDSFGF